MSGNNLAVDMKKNGKSKDSLDLSVDSLESGDSRTDDSLEILHDSLGKSQLTIFYFFHKKLTTMEHLVT